jgi:hypothetical protein
LSSGKAKTPSFFWIGFLGFKWDDDFFFLEEVFWWEEDFFLESGMVTGVKPFFFLDFSVGMAFDRKLSTTSPL